jgi:hypothetical protein
MPAHGYEPTLEGAGRMHRESKESPGMPGLSKEMSMLETSRDQGALAR